MRLVCLQSSKLNFLASGGLKGLTQYTFVYGKAFIMVNINATHIFMPLVVLYLGRLRKHNTGVEEQRYTASKLC